MSLLSNLVSGLAGAGIATVAKDFIEKQGGVSAIVSQFQEKGFGDTVKSWVSTGANLPISADQIAKVLGGSATVAALAEKFGVSQETLHAQLAEHLPGVIDKLTPNGKVEEQAAA